MDQLFVDDRIICIILFRRKNEVSQKSLNTRTVPMYAACNHNFLYCLFRSLRFFSHNIVMLFQFINNHVHKCGLHATLMLKGLNLYGSTVL